MVAKSDVSGAGTTSDSIALLDFFLPFSTSFLITSLLRQHLIKRYNLILSFLIILLIFLSFTLFFFLLFQQAVRLVKEDEYL